MALGGRVRMEPEPPRRFAKVGEPGMPSEVFGGLAKDGTAKAFLFGKDKAES